MCRGLRRFILRGVVGVVVIGGVNDVIFWGKEVYIVVKVGF